MKLKTSSQNDNDEKVPAHTVRRLNDGRDRVLVEVTLPGVSGAAELIVLIRDRSISVRAPGLYNLVLSLDVSILEKPEAIKFVKKSSKLKAYLLVDEAYAEPAVAHSEKSSAAAAQRPGGSAPPMKVHSSFLDDAVRLRDRHKGDRVAASIGVSCSQGGTTTSGTSKPSSSAARAASEAMLSAAGGGYSTEVSEESDDDEDDGLRNNDTPGGLSDGEVDTTSHAMSSSSTAAASGGLFRQTPGSIPQSTQKQSTQKQPPASQPASSSGASPNVWLPASDFDSNRPDENPLSSGQSAFTPPPASHMEGDGGMYAAATARQNAEAAGECARAAQAAMADGQQDRAWRFVQKGRRLLGDHSDGPMNIEELLQKLGVARDAQAAAGAHSTSSSGSGSNTTKPGSAPAPGAPGSGTARSRARQQQQEQQQQQQQQHSQQKRPLHSPARGRPADGARMGGSSNHQKQQQQRQHDVDHQDKHQNSQQYAQHGNNSHHSSPTGKDDSNSTAFHSGVWQESVPTGFLWCDECHTMHPDPNCDPSDPPDPSEAADEAAESEARDTERTREEWERQAKLPKWQRYCHVAWASTKLVFHLGGVYSLALTRCIVSNIWECSILPAALLIILFGSRSQKHWFKSVMEERRATDAGIRVGSLAVTVIGLYGLRWWILGLAWLIRRCVGAVIDHCLWDPTWIGSLFNAGILYWLGQREKLLGAFVFYPLLFKILGGGMWALLGGFTVMACSLATRSAIASFLVVIAINFGVPYLGFVVSVFATACVLAFAVVLFLASESSSRSSAGGVGVGHLKPEVPPGATGEIQRVLTAANFYEVLELASDAEPSAVKRAKFAKALLTHPDKAKGAIGANEAFQRVNQASEVLSDPGKRRKYDAEIAAVMAAEVQQAAARAQSASRASAVGKGMDSSPTFLSDIPPWALNESGDYILLLCKHCTKFYMPRPVLTPMSTARYCERCNRQHPAKNGMGWVETTGGLFATRKFFLAQYGMVWDASEYADCEGFLWSKDLLPNAHSPSFSFKVLRRPDGSTGPGGSGKGAGTGFRRPSDVDSSKHSRSSRRHRQR